MKDIYWDIRPKPTFGTVEVRVCDTPLTIAQAVNVVAYAQALAHFLVKERKFSLTQDLYLVYNYNRFQACRYGYDGKMIDPYSLKHISIHEDILKTLQEIKPHAKMLGTLSNLAVIEKQVTEKYNDATKMREIFASEKSLHHLVEKECDMWLNQFK